MLTRPKQIVIDKDVFVGSKADALCSFAGNHFLLLSDILFYECATTKKQDPRTLLGKYENVLKAGAYCCSMHRHFVEWEAWYCKPFREVVADLAMTERVRRDDGLSNTILDSDAPDALYRARVRMANELFAELSRWVKEKVDSSVEDVRAQVKSIPNAPSERLCTWLGSTDKMDIHKMAVESLLAGWIRAEGEFCLSADWMTWHLLRLCTTTVHEYLYSRQTGGPRDAHAEHDFADVEYALLLARADGLITRDKRLTNLARAAFPEKGVFSSLDVPASYRRDQTNS